MELAENLALSHQHSHTTSHSNGGTSNVFTTPLAINVALASLSTVQPSVPVLNPADRRILNGTNADSSGTFTMLMRKQSDDGGLIDIAENRATKSSKKPVLESGTSDADSPSTSSEATLIAARVAQTVWQSQRKSSPSTKVVPAIFGTANEGGFIELVATATNQIPAARDANRMQTLARHDQVDAEIGHFVGFEGADVFGSSVLGVTTPKRVAPTDSHDTTDANAATSTNRLSWGLLLSAGLAATLWRPPVRSRRMMQTWLRSLATRCRRAAKSFTVR